MANRGIRLYLIISVIFYAAVFGYLWYSVDSVRTGRFNEASAKSEFISNEIQSAYPVARSFSSGYFRNRMSGIFSKDADLLAVVISDSEGPVYINAVDGSLITNVNGKPSLALSNPFLREFKSEITLDSGKSASVSIVFDLLNRSSIFPVLRNSMTAAALYLLFTVIILSLRPASSKPVSETEITPDQTDNAKAVETGLNEDSAESAATTAAEPDTDKGCVQLQSAGLYSDKSGLVCEHFLNERLDAELKRAASFDQDSCLAFISILSPSGFIPYRNISELIVEHFKYKDLAFESGDNTFCIIIPDKDIDEGLSDVEKFKKSIRTRFPDSSFRLYAGLTSRNSRLLSDKRMIHEAKAALARAEAENESTTISFRTDLNKYREYIASTV